MTALVDTPVWSAAFRRRIEGPDREAGELRELIREGGVRIIGAVRQEVLSGIREPGQFERLRERLRDFPDLVLDEADHERAAEMYNTCRAKGVQGSNTDFLICAVAERRDMPILTTDGDFTHFAKHIPIRLHRLRA